MRADQAILQDYIRSRDGEVFAELVQRHAGMVFGVCRRVLADRTLAEDAAQETFLHLLRHPAEVTGSLVGWLHKVAHGKAVDLVRREAAQGRRKREQALLPPPEAERPWAEISPLLDQALAELPMESREVLVAHYLQGANQVELAARLKLSQSTVSRRLAGAVAALRERLAVRGVVHSVAALALALDHGPVSTVPATLASELGKMALAGQAGIGGTVAAAGTGSGLALGTKVALVAILAGGGAVATTQLARAPAVVPADLPAWRMLGPGGGGIAPAAAPPAPADVIDAQGPLVLVAASTFGGAGDDAVVGVGIAPDHTILVAANVVEPALGATVARTLIGPAGTRQEAPPMPEAGKKPAAHPSLRGMIARLSPEGRTLQAVTAFGYGQAQLRRLQVDAQGAVVVLGDNNAGADLGGGPGKGRFIARLDAQLAKPQWILYREGASDFAFDGNGDLVVLADKSLVRYDSATGKEKWTATWKTHGDNRPGGMSVDPASGIATVVGYGMTNTGKEPYKDPYAYGFDRDGKQAWMLWNPDPKREVAAKFGGNGLMADTTGAVAGVSEDGRFLLSLYADGGNTVCSRDPLDPDKPLAPSVFKDVHQDGPGYGFKGASKTSVVFRVEPRTGALEKGTWFCSWLTPQRANGLAIDAVSGTGGKQFVVGSSASGLPLKLPWYAHNEGAYQGGGYLAVFDAGFKLQQCGYFSNSSLRTVASRDGWVVVGGTIRPSTKPEEPVRVQHPFQAAAGGDQDGYVLVFRAR